MLNISLLSSLLFLYYCHYITPLPTHPKLIQSPKLPLSTFNFSLSLPHTFSFYFKLFKNKKKYFFFYFTC
ncbi:hypothetical protein GLYMA_12G228333v4 [Glycine max]|nr:hypothetical protein GLYMA_12G228333v4 [Glycine max]KAH1144495.1 hypothetical protein GYH30_034634 [Glycine max]